jgi:DnaJ-class molecular chaperone
MCHVCERCGGSGHIWNRAIRANQPCPACHGSGSALRDNR